MDLWGILAWFALGAAAATFGSVVGLGGGVILVPGLIAFGELLTGEEIGTGTAVGTSLVVLIVTALSSTWAFARRKRVDFRSGLLYAAASVPASAAGAAMTETLRPAQFELAFGVFMLALSGLLFARSHMRPLTRAWPVKRMFADADGRVHEYGHHPVWAVGIGLGVGFVSGLFGIGGGSLFVPAMVLLFRYPPHVATATSMFVILLSACSGSLTHIAQSNVDWAAAAALAPGAWLGGIWGAWITSRMSGQALLNVLRVTFVLLALRMIASGLTG